MDPAELDLFLAPNRFVDSDHAAVGAFVQEHAPSGTPLQRTVALYYAVRDGFRYNPWNVHTRPQDYAASAVLTRARDLGGHCIDKATVLAACARRVGVPSRLHFANVRNHIGTEELERRLGTDLLVFHGYVELFLDGRWVAATPAFNRQLCAYLNVAPLEFDGSFDSIFQQFDRAGGRFMEYVHDYGTWPEIPFDLMISEWKRYYPSFAQAHSWPTPGP